MIVNRRQVDAGLGGEGSHGRAPEAALGEEAFGRVEVDVFTPSPLEPAQLDAIKQRVGAALSKEPVVYAYTDSSMIGGLKLRIGDQLIDGSVAARLRRMRHRFLTTGSAAIRENFDRILEQGDGQ